MKKTILLAALLIVAVFGIMACGPKSSAATVATAEAKLPDSVSKSNTQAQPVPVNTLERTTMVMTSTKAWVKERVGASPLNIYRTVPATIKPLDGYRAAILKPKIKRAPNNYFAGFGADHNARADV